MMRRHLFRFGIMQSNHWLILLVTRLVARYVQHHFYIKWKYYLDRIINWLISVSTIFFIRFDYQTLNTSKSGWQSIEYRDSKDRLCTRQIIQGITTTLMHYSFSHHTHKHDIDLLRDLPPLAPIEFIPLLFCKPLQLTYPFVNIYVDWVVLCVEQSPWRRRCVYFNSAA